MLLENYTLIDCRHIAYFLFVCLFLLIWKHPRNVVGGNQDAIAWAQFSDILAEVNTKGTSSHSSD